MYHKTATLISNWLKFTFRTFNNLVNEVTKDKIDSGLRKIEESNKHLSELEVIKLKRIFLDDIDKKLDAKLQNLEQRF